MTTTTAAADTSSRTNIFFAGTVHEAIATSVQQRYALVCFVTDGGDEGSRWESEYLIDAEVFGLLQTDVILLRLEAGSHEASLLAEVCPVREIPHLLIIKDSAVLVKLTAGVSRELFTASIKNALTNKPSFSSPHPAPAPPQPSVSTPPAETVTPVTSPPGAPSTPSPSFNAARPETPRRDHTPLAAAEGTGATAGRRESLRPGSQSYLEQQRAKKLAEQAERQRILRLLENDKAERQVRERERRGSMLVAQPETPRTRSAEPPIGEGEVALSFRLTDGSNVKSRFSTSATLGEDVRAWIEQNRTDGDHPYNFVEILGPSDNRSLGISDESLPLSTLFKRSATLVLVPIETTASTAYSGATATGHGILSHAYGLISGALNTVWNWSSFAPMTEEPLPPPPPRREGRRVGTVATRVRTLRDQEEDAEQKKYYNGNQLSVEPKPDEK
ncbi:hypothetical protein FN846DRAFT_115293 [Sphaerosporella brunnea]|uniref:UBX domain-containing protein n=1 Tax=Sphaerosporella brunnea TaxID=1250544 RepID=A0A5J5ESD5_9PEZI|nr:hypothetical protein FN846DRAFT_115293 [Sphaerosporella brunnea]